MRSQITLRDSCFLLFLNFDCFFGDKYRQLVFYFVEHFLPLLFCFLCCVVFVYITISLLYCLFDVFKTIL